MNHLLIISADWLLCRISESFRKIGNKLDTAVLQAIGYKWQILQRQSGPIPVSSLEGPLKSLEIVGNLLCTGLPQTSVAVSYLFSDFYVLPFNAVVWSWLENLMSSESPSDGRNLWWAPFLIVLHQSIIVRRLTRALRIDQPLCDFVQWKSKAEITKSVCVKLWPD